MKKFLVVLLSLGLVMAFSMSAFAVTPDFTGQYYARGSYISNPSLLEQDKATGRDSYGYYDQRLRMFFRLKIVEGVTFTTRFDALEAIWGRDQGQHSGPFTNSTTPNKTLNETSLSFEQAYVTFATGIGKWDVGYKSGTPYGWGTDFMNATGTAPGIKWSNTFGPVTVLADLNKASKGDAVAATGAPNLRASDVDNDYYDLGATFKFKGGEAGALWTYFRNAVTRTSASALMTSAHVIQPYVKTKLGPVDLQAEAYWMNGKIVSDVATTADVNIDTKGLYVNGRFNMGPAYVGGIFLYASGDDPSTTDKMEGGMNATFKYGGNTGPFAGNGFNPVILFGDDYHDYLTTVGDPSVTDPSSRPDNVFMYQVYGGFQFTKKLSLNAKYSILQAAQEPTTTGWQSKSFGSELDTAVTYQIYDKLSYNVGAAYLWTGDYFKGTNSSAVLQNNYMLTHWIDLRF